MEIQRSFDPIDGTQALQRQYLTFELGGQEYAVAVLSVREIIEYRPITSVPLTPDWLLGVLNLRGSVVPVLDLSRRFLLEPTPISKRTCVVISEISSGNEVAEFGMLVDLVKEVIFLGEDQIQPKPELGDRGDAFALEGIASIEDRFVLLIDCEKAFTREAIEMATAEPLATGHVETDAREGAGGL